MSKRVQLYRCDECGETYSSKEDADRCERSHVERREQNEQEEAWRKFDDDFPWRLTKDQIRQLRALAESLTKDKP